MFEEVFGFCAVDQDIAFVAFIDNVVFGELGHFNVVFGHHGF